jgi:hypothetical protein
MALYVCQDRNFVGWGFMSEKTLGSVGDCIIFKSRARLPFKAQYFMCPELV